MSASLATEVEIMKTTSWLMSFVRWIFATILILLAGGVAAGRAAETARAAVDHGKDCAGGMLSGYFS